MPKHTDNESMPDAENPEWTRERLARSKSFSELPERVQKIFGGGRGKRGPQKAPTKTLISIRLSPDVLEALKASGEGWQSRVDDTLRQHFIKG